jgi:hypothetical protein
MRETPRHEKPPFRGGNGEGLNVDPAFGWGMPDLGWCFTDRLCETFDAPDNTGEVLRTF